MAHRKATLPTKVCPTCGRSFAWRRRWRLNWDRVIYCSERCRRGAPSASRAPNESKNGHPAP